MTEAHLDTATLSSLQQIMVEDYLLLLETFLLDSAERMAVIRKGCAQADYSALRLAAHSFKGSCSNMGAPALAALCKALEAAAKQADRTCIAHLCERIEHEQALVSGLITAECQRCRTA